MKALALLFTVPGRCRGRKFFAFWALPIVMLLALPAFARTGTEALELDDSKDRLPLGDHLEILEDHTGQLTLADVEGPPHAENFKPHPTSVLHLDKPWVTYWLRLNLSDTQDGKRKKTHDEKWVLELNWSAVAMVKLHTPKADGGWRSVHSGFMPPEEPDVPTIRLPVFVLDLGGQKNASVYLQIKNFGSPPIQLKLHKAKQSSRLAKIRMLLLGLYFGILLAMALYNLSIFNSLRQVSYLWYVLSVVFLGMYNLGFSGLSYEFAPPYLDLLFYHRPCLVWLAISFLSIGLFTKDFLFTKRYSRFINRTLNVSLAVWFVAPIFFIALPSTIIDPLMSLLASLYMVVLFLAGMICWRKGFRPARFFLPAWCFAALGGVVLSLTVSGLAPYSAMGFYAGHIGTAMEMILLSLALADRVRTLRNERDSYEEGQRRFRELSIRDELTGTYNKRYLLKELPLLIEIAVREKQNLSVAVLDLDDFKKYNDTYGHLEGDKVLVAFARVIEDCLREGDLACRFGGEEFIVILPGSSFKGAHQVADRIRTRLFQQEFKPVLGKIVRVSTSIGLAGLRADDDYRSLLERADQALYRAKSEGKNRTALAAEG